MGECVVRMEMPQNRCPVRFSIAANGYCLIEDRSGCGLDVTKERPDWCPIICQLPEGHGDLIDRNKLLGDIEMYHVSDGCFQHWVESQDAVIPAETESI